jgi:uncharacterized protein YraI
MRSYKFLDLTIESKPGRGIPSQEEEMKTRTFTVVLVLMALMLACNVTTAPQSGTPNQVTLPGSGGTSLPPTDTPNPLPSDTPKPLPSDTPTITLTSTFTLTPTNTLTSTPSAAMVTPKAEDVNCRFGPGTTYLGVGGLKVGTSVPILGQNGDGTWWQITNPNNIIDKCWVSASATDASGNMGSIPVTPAPKPFVTKVTASNPDNISVAGCLGSIPPQTLTGTIDVNGPVAVTWHFETQQGGALGNHVQTFTKYGPQTVTDNSYTPPLVAGTYWVHLVVTAPNSIKGEASYTITCP